MSNQLQTPEWESWEHSPVQQMDMLGSGQTLSSWNSSINQEVFRLYIVLLLKLFPSNKANEHNSFVATLAIVG